MINTQKVTKKQSYYFSTQLQAIVIINLKIFMFSMKLSYEKIMFVLFAEIIQYHVNGNSTQSCIS